MKYQKYVFQMLINDEGNETYLPDFNFEYLVVDCQECKNLTAGLTWKKIFESSLPIVFINTSYMFQQFSKENGEALWAQEMYYHYRDLLWKENKTKFIFLVTDENLQQMLMQIDFGFAMELIPCYMRINKKEIRKKVKFDNGH